MNLSKVNLNESYSLILNVKFYVLYKVLFFIL